MSLVNISCGRFETEMLIYLYYQKHCLIWMSAKIHPSIYTCTLICLVIHFFLMIWWIKVCASNWFNQYICIRHWLWRIIGYQECRWSFQVEPGPPRLGLDDILELLNQNVFFRVRIQQIRIWTFISLFLITLRTKFLTGTRCLSHIILD